MKRQTKQLSFDDSCPNCFADLDIGKLEDNEFVGFVCHRCGQCGTAHSPNINVLWSGPDLRIRDVVAGPRDSEPDKSLEKTELDRRVNDYTSLLLVRKCKRLLRDGKTDRECARELEIPMAKVKRIRLGREYAWVTPILRSQENYVTVKFRSGSSKTKEPRSAQNSLCQLFDLFG